MPLPAQRSLKGVAGHDISLKSVPASASAFLPLSTIGPAVPVERARVHRAVVAAAVVEANANRSLPLLLPLQASFTASSPFSSPKAFSILAAPPTAYMNSALVKDRS